MIIGNTDLNSATVSKASEKCYARYGNYNTHCEAIKERKGHHLTNWYFKNSYFEQQDMSNLYLFISILNATEYSDILTPLV